MKEVPVIETKRLMLKAVMLEDAEDIFAYVKNPNVLRYTQATTPHEPSETEAYVRGLVEKSKESSGAFAWAIRLKDRPVVIGVVEFNINNDTSGSVDYALSEEYWNQGIMTETVRLVLRWAFRNHPLLDCVSSSAMTANPASTRVQQKCGMKFLRYERPSWSKFDDPVELKICAISRKEWEAVNQGIQPTFKELC